MRKSPQTKFRNAFYYSFLLEEKPKSSNNAMQVGTTGSLCDCLLLSTLCWGYNEGTQVPSLSLNNK